MMARVVAPGISVFLVPRLFLNLVEGSACTLLDSPVGETV